MLDLLLVNPQEDYGEVGKLAAIEPPLWCALLAAYVQERGYSVAILDAEVERLGAEAAAKRIAEANPMLCAIIVLGHSPSVSSTPKMTAVGKLVKALRMTFSGKIVIGGLHPSALPERTLRETGADYVIQGEGFEALVGLLGSLEVADIEPIIPGLYHVKHEGMVTYGGRAPLLAPDELPTAAWYLLPPLKQYRCHNWHSFTNSMKRSPYAVLWTSLGCPYNCEFCNVAAMYGGRGIRYRHPVDVADEVAALASRGVRNFKIMDEMFAFKEDRVVEVCSAIAALGYKDLNIWAYGRADSCQAEMLKAMRAAGIRWLCIGFESAVERVRQGVAKKFDQGDMGQSVQRCHAADINVLGNFLFGLPDDDMDTMRETLETAKSLSLDWVNFYIVLPYPGSELYQRAVWSHVKLPKRWADWSQYSKRFMPLATQHVSGKAVLEFRDRAFEEFFGRSEYLSMVEGKFGLKARKHVEGMLKVEVRK